MQTFQWSGHTGRYFAAVGEGGGAAVAEAPTGSEAAPATTPSTGQEPPMPTASEIRKAFRAQQGQPSGDADGGEGAAAGTGSEGQPATPAKPADGTPAKPEGEAPISPVDPDQATPTTTTEGQVADEPVYEVPPLSEEDAKNPLLKQRHEEMTAGFKKVVDAVQAERAEIKTAMPMIERMAAVTEQLDAGPASAGDALAEVVQASARMHKVSVETIFNRLAQKLGVSVAAATGGGTPPAPGQAAQPSTGAITKDNWQDHFEHEEDFNIYEKAKNDAKAEIRAELGIDPAELKDVVQTTKQTKEAQQREKRWGEYLDHYLPNVQGHFKTHFAGYEVSRDMLAKAVESFPQHSRKPELAVQGHFVQQLNAHMAKKRADGAAPRLPSGPESEAAPGVQGVDDPEKITASSIRRAAAARKAN